MGVPSPIDRLVYDCNVYLQFLLNNGGPSARCVTLAFEKRVELFISDAILDELRELPEKQIAIEASITDEVVSDMIGDLLTRATWVAHVPGAYDHPIDPDDSAYVDLAIAVDATLIVSRDKHLLNLTNPAKPWSDDFRRRFPAIRVMRPEEYLRERADAPR